MDSNNNPRNTADINDDDDSDDDYDLSPTSSGVRLHKMESQSDISNNDIIASQINFSDNAKNMTPYFQRVLVSESVREVPLDNVENTCKVLLEALELRERYMLKSNQSFCKTTARYLNLIRPEDKNLALSANKAEERRRTSSIPIDNPWDIEFYTPLGYSIKSIDGVMNVFKDKNFTEKLNYDYPKINEFYNDLLLLTDMIAHGPLKTFCYQRLIYLQSKFQLHVLLNELRETNQQKEALHKDFYNVRKVDTHIHAASSMNQKHLLRFIKHTLKKYPNEIVEKTPEGEELTLAQVFETLNLAPHELNIDMLDVHANRLTFQRFDRFDRKYNPIGDALLRKTFLKTDNYLKGKYFAKMLKEVFYDLEESKYSYAEMRISIYGAKPDEWSKLANWVISNDLQSKHIRWLIQVPRLCNIYKIRNLVNSFQDVLDNLFLPVFEATNDPNKYPEIHRFLQYVIGFDSVGDESLAFMPESETLLIPPKDWNGCDNPPYSYYIYYMYANIATLNHFRKEHGLNTFAFRPHCGEAGALQHLISGFLMSENISHGIQLRQHPLLQYLFYLAQIGIAMSPLSNNSLFVSYYKNPLPKFFARGLMVSLSTDDPLQFHFTKEPLMEEYSVAAQVWKFNSCDMCELARNSVLMSGFPHKLKKSWLGTKYTEEGVAGNDISYTNVPNIRVAFRHETLVAELKNLSRIYEKYHDN